ncbi:recombinase family protein [Paenarthrobacter nicotinovorans]|uniref:recombinase family protein n=1 Tax=Paenarthrobacter nicotinovorans TaxID=29320 RepID=UPI001EE38E83|nr:MULTISPECIES: recombinase family protein [Micrococcaceae]
MGGAGIEAQPIYVDEKSGTTTNRPGLQEAVRHARAGDVIVVHTLDRFGRTVRDTWNLVHVFGAKSLFFRLRPPRTCSPGWSCQGQRRYLRPERKQRLCFSIYVGILSRYETRSLA